MSQNIISAAHAAALNDISDVDASDLARCSPDCEWRTDDIASVLANDGAPNDDDAIEAFRTAYRAEFSRLRAIEIEHTAGESSERYWLQIITSDGQATDPGDEAVFGSEADAMAATPELEACLDAAPGSIEWRIVTDPREPVSYAATERARARDRSAEVGQ